MRLCPDVLYRVADKLRHLVVVAMLPCGIGHGTPERDVLADMPAHIDRSTDIGVVVLKPAVFFVEPLPQRLLQEVGGKDRAGNRTPLLGWWNV